MGRKLSILPEETEDISPAEILVDLSKKENSIGSRKNLEFLNDDNSTDSASDSSATTTTVRTAHDSKTNTDNRNDNKSKNHRNVGLNLPLTDPLTQSTWQDVDAMSPGLVSPQSITSQILALTSPVSPFSASPYSLSLEDLEISSTNFKIDRDYKKSVSSNGNCVHAENFTSSPVDKPGDDKSLTHLILYSEHPIVTSRRKNYLRSASLPCDSGVEDSIRKNLGYRRKSPDLRMIEYSEQDLVNESDVVSVSDQKFLIQSECDEPPLEENQCGSLSRARPLQITGHSRNNNTNSSAGVAVQSIVAPASAVALSLMAASCSNLQEENQIRRSSLTLPPGPADLCRALRKGGSFHRNFTPDCSPLSSPSYRTPPEGTPWSSPRPSLDTTGPSSWEHWELQDCTSMSSCHATPFHTPRPSLVLESSEGIPSLVLVEGSSSPDCSVITGASSLSRTSSERRHFPESVEGGPLPDQPSSLPFLPSHTSLSSYQMPTANRGAVLQNTEDKSH